MRSRGSDESTAGPAVGASRGGGSGPRPGGRAIAAHARRQPAGARHLPRADRDQYHRLAGEHAARSEEHTSELQSQSNLVCRLLLEKKKKMSSNDYSDDITT